MHETLKFLRRKRKSKSNEDVTWINAVRMPYYNPTMISLYSYGESLLNPEYKGNAYPMAYWGVEYICEGDLSIVKDETTLHLKAGDLLILYPGMRYMRINSGTVPVKKKEIMLNNSPLISILCNRSDLKGREVIHCTHPEKVENFFDTVQQLVSSSGKSVDLEQILPNTVFALFTELITQSKEKSIYNSFDDQLKNLDVFSPDLTLEKIAEHFSVGTRTLNRMFNKHLNCSPFQYLIAVRMRYAAQLLSSNTLSIREVAEECGYKSASFFIAEFKKYFQKTPLSYRRTPVVSDSGGPKKLDIWSRKRPRKKTQKTSSLNTEKSS